VNQALLANTQYWIGVVGDPSTNATWVYGSAFSASDVGVSGQYSAFPASSCPDGTQDGGLCITSNQSALNPSGVTPFEMQLTTSAVPEPSTLASVGGMLGVFGLVAVFRRRKLQLRQE
jgi:hypothetical protein